MSVEKPLVTIAIPTFNRADRLTRTISSALAQTHGNIELIISDNASTDDTEALCTQFAAKDHRVQYVRHHSNLGPSANFNWLLSQGNGKYFMWLGDDDWIDPNYIEECLGQLASDQSLAVVGGNPFYYRPDGTSFSGRFFSILGSTPQTRIASYLFRVADNGIFYGLYRKDRMKQLKLTNVLAGDWFFICEVLVSGGFRMIRTTSVHRELGGASDSLRKLFRAYGFSQLAWLVPNVYFWRSFFGYLAHSPGLSGALSPTGWRLFIGAIILLRPISNIPYRLRRLLPLD